MIDLYSLSREVAKLAPLANSVGKHFADRPGLLEVAREVLAVQLAISYPALSLDSARLELMEPMPKSAGGSFAGYHRRALTEVLMQRYLDPQNLLLVDDYHFLTHEGGTEQPGALAVRMAEVQRIINEWGPELLNVYGQKLCSYWDAIEPQGGNRWKWLARWLQAHLRTCIEREQKAGRLDHDHAASAMVLVSMAEARDRRRYSGDVIKASLISVKALTASPQAKAQLTHALVIQRHLSRERRDLIMLYAPAQGLRAFNTLDAVAAEMAARIANEADRDSLLMALYEPDEHVFEVQAQAILEQQLVALQEVGQHCRSEHATHHDLQTQIERVTCLFEIDTAEEAAKLEALRGQVPAWLLSADASAQRQYSLYLADLATLRAEQAGATFLDGIPPIEIFARQALLKALQKRHPGAAESLLDDIAVHILTTPDAAMSIVGGGQHTLSDHVISLTQLALFNLSGRPQGHLIIEPAPGKTLPGWVDTAAIEALISEVDAGGAYTRLLQTKLKDDPVEARTRQTHFCRQLSLQLPMLALENQVQQLHGMTEVGYRYVAGLMKAPAQAVVEGKAIALRRLAFTAARGRRPDVVTGMFVIGAMDDSGVHILYRPLATPILMQFDDAEQLFAAITDPGPLQDSVLDWLEPSVRSVYARGGFAEPHIIRFGLGSDFAALERPAPARLSLLALSDDVLDQVYADTVQGLIGIARRRSVSSEDSRWISYQALGWTLFNGLLPIFSGPLATAGWMIQTMTSFGVALKAQSQGSSTAVEDVFVDMLFNIALVLLTHGVSHAPWIRAYPQERIASTVAPSTRFQAALTTVEQVGSELNFSWSRATHTLTREDTERLSRLRVKPPLASLSPIPHGLLQGLFQEGERWLASLDGHFYQVSLEDAQVRIVDPANPAAPGPWLERDEVHRWRLDLSLRLRGGSPKRAIELKRSENKARRDECGRMIDAYNAKRTEMNVKVNVLIRKIGLATTAAEAALLATLRERLSDEIEPYLQSLRNTLTATIELRTLQPGFDRSREHARLLGFMHELGTQELANLRMRSQAVNEQARELGELLQKQDLDARQSLIFFDFIRRSTDLTDRQIQLTREVSDWLRQLERVPLEGERVLKELLPSVETQLPLSCWISTLIDGLGLLCVRKVAQLPLATRILTTVVNPVRLAAQNHAELQQSGEFSLNDRVEVLNSVESQCCGALEALEQYRQRLETQLDLPAVDRMRVLIEGLRSDAAQDLVPLIREQEKMTRKQRRSARHASIIFTQRRGVVVFKRRTAASAAQPETVEVVEPVEQKVIATFHKDVSAGEWIQTSSQKPVAAVVRSLNTVVSKSAPLLKGADKEVLAAWRLVNKPYIPSEVEDQLLAYADQLSAQAELIDQQLTLRNETDHAVAEHQSAEVKAKALRDKAAQLTEEGRLIRIDMTKRQAPSISRVNYLVQHKAVQIRKVGGRRMMKKGRDFMQEYEVADLENKPLWYAHFHYLEARGLPGNYERAHLKTAAQRLDGVHKQMAQELAGAEVIAILRSRIDAPLDQIFLKLDEGEPAASASAQG